MSHKDLILSPEFALYRKALVRVIVQSIKDCLLRVDHGELKGILGLSKKVLRLPATLVKDDKLKPELQKMLGEDFNRVYIELARQGIENE